MPTVDLPHPLQRLYDACKSTFASVAGAHCSPPSSHGVQYIKSITDSITLSDLGLTEDIVAQEDRYSGTLKPLTGWRDPHSSMVAWWSPPIAYRHIYECERFSIGVFVLPKLAVMPFHNHPGMTVVSKVLCGSMHMMSYDWVQPSVQIPETGPAKVRLARLVIDHVLKAPCESSVLYPCNGGNIHAIKALAPCALLDVLCPPYSETEGRDITYYRSFPCTVCNGNSAGSVSRDFAWLAELQLIDDVVKRVPYEIPRLVL